jgi:hypothetical protein
MFKITCSCASIRRIRMIIGSSPSLFSGSLFAGSARCTLLAGLAIPAFGRKLSCKTRSCASMNCSGSLACSLSLRRLRIQKIRTAIPMRTQTAASDPAIAAVRPPFLRERRRAVSLESLHYMGIPVGQVCGYTQRRRRYRICRTGGITGNGWTADKW